MSDIYHVHLVSDSTGATTQGVLKACIVQFEGVEVEEHIWPMILSTAQVEKVIEGIRANPGPVIFTMVNARVRQPLVAECTRLNVPCVSVLDPVIESFARFFNRTTDPTATSAARRAVHISFSATSITES